MYATMTTARITGALFIAATALGVASGIIMGAVLGAEDYLAALAANAGNARIAASLEVLMAGAIIAIPVTLYPVMRAFDQTLAVGYLVARLAEGLLIAIGAIALLTAIDLSQASADSAYPALGAMLDVGGQTAFNMGALVFFGASALILNTVLWRARLVPALISVWGLIGGALVVILGFVTMFGPPPGALGPC